MTCLRSSLPILTLVAASGCSHPTQPSHPPEPTSETEAPDFAGDVDFVCQQVRDGYAYLETMAVDWDAACHQARQRAEAARDEAEFLAVLEDLIEELHDDHVHLGINGESSPRLVPSHLAVWAEPRSSRAVVTAVRAQSWAAQAGIVAGDEIVSIDGQTVDVALSPNLPTHRTREDARSTRWALRRTIVGTHDHAPVLQLDGADGSRTVSRPMTATPPPRQGLLQVRTHDQGIGHIRFHNSLGDSDTIAAFDAALDEHPEWTALVLDLRDTPGGGNTTVARGIMGRLIREEAAYQRHELPAQLRAHGIARAWVELVAPRGRTFEGPVVVLVGRWTGSMGEGTAIGLQGMGRGRVVGTRMAGLAGAIYDIVLPGTGWSVALPVEALYRVDGTPRELVEPDVHVDLAASPGEDPVLDAGLTQARSEMP